AGGASPAPGAGPGGASPAPGAGPGGASPVPGAGLADATRWRATGGSVTATGAGLRFTLSPDLAGGGWLQPVDTPYPLPVVGTGGPPDGGRLTGLDERQVQVFTAGRAAALPRLGTAGTLVDLEYADRAATDGGTALRPEVWLGADAPDDVLARLARTGLVVTGDVSIATARDRLDAQGPAIGLWFHLLAGALALLLGAVGLSMIVAVDRPARAADRAALRAQGVDGPAVRLANRWTYPALVLTAATLGLVTALAAWRLTGWALPMFGEDLPPLPLPRWPGPVAVPATWLAGVTLLLAVAVRVGGTAPAPRPAPR
ncbi:ABC transporter permease, partial [Dactylosporangium sp. NPDC050588]